MNSLVLRCSYSEEQLVQFIKDDIAPEIKNRLSFENNPTSFRDLEAITISANNKGYLDYLRDERFFSQPKPVLNTSNSRNTYLGSSRSNPIRQHSSHQRFEPNLHNVGGGKPVCFKCGQPGHIARNCSSNVKTNQGHPLN